MSRRDRPHFPLLVLLMLLAVFPGASPAAAQSDQDPRFTDVSDILGGQRSLLRIDDVVVIRFDAERRENVAQAYWNPTGKTHAGGAARVWFNDAQALSRASVIIDGVAKDLLPQGRIFARHLAEHGPQERARRHGQQRQGLPRPAVHAVRHLEPRAAVADRRHSRRWTDTGARRRLVTSSPCYTSPVRDDALPLAGLIIVDLTRVLAGPYCTRLLADLGARVIKIERPGEGDEMRRNPHQLEPGRLDQSSYFTRVNAGKESVGVDLSNPRGRDVVLDLARRADVFVENFMPGVAGRLGCDYEAVRAVKPDVVYCSISGFGQTGPWRARPAFAHIINAVSGMMYLEQGDEAAPRASNLQAADVLAANHACTAILAALWRRSRTGQGARLDVSMLEALVSADSVTFASVLNGGGEHGNPRPGLLVYEIGGRHVAFQIAGSPQLWPRLVALMGRPELAKDSRFLTSDARRRNSRALRQLIGEWVKGFATADDALAVLAEARIPCAPVLKPAELIAEPHLAERRFFPSVPHPGRDAVRVTASPYHVDGEPVHPRGSAPYRIGEHTRAVLGELLGYAPERIDDLERAGVVESA